MIRNYSNTVNPTNLVDPISSSTVTINVVSTTGFPALPFTIGVDRGTPDEEVMLVTGQTGTTFTVVRGYNSTSAVAHLAGAAVEHCVCALDYHEANRHIEDPSRDDHTQYLTHARASEHFPRFYSGTAKATNTNLNTNWQQVNSLTVPSAPFDRQFMLFGTLTMEHVSGQVQYQTRLRLLGSADTLSLQRGSTHTLGFLAFSMSGIGSYIASGASPTFVMESRRDTGASSTVDIGTQDYSNRLSALALPAV